MDDEEFDLPEAKSYEHYMWDCECGEVNDAGDIQPVASIPEECVSCGKMTRVE